MDTLTQESFRPIRLADRELFLNRLSIQDNRSCECNFANLFCWGPELKLCFTEYKQRLLACSIDEKYLLFPIGEYFPPEELLEITRTLYDLGMAENCYDVPEDYLKQYPDAERFFNIKCNEDYFDYIHEAESLVTLSGKRLRKKRNLIKQFTEEYPDAECLEMTCDNSWECKELGMRMNLQRPEDLLMHNETVALQFAFQYFKDLELEGLAVKVNGHVVAFSIFSRINRDTYDIHFEKADHDCKGATQYINFKVAEYLQSKCRYINREQDLGLEGLRRAKRSYDPEIMYRRHEFTITPR